MSDRDIQEYLDGLRAEPPADDQESLAAYTLLYEALRRDLPHGLPATFAEAVSDRLLAPPRKAQTHKEPALEWILPLLGLMPIILFALLQTVPLWLDRVAALRSYGADGPMPDLLTLSSLVGGIFLIGILDTLLSMPRPSRRIA
jgi:hypothetical protein